MLSLRSKLTQALLLFFFINPFEEIYLHELSRILDVKVQNLHKKLKELEAIGFFKSKLKGKERYYSLNCEWPLHRDYRNIIKKTMGVPHVIAENLETVRYLESVYVKMSDPFNVQKEIQIIILQSLNAYNKPSKKVISETLKRLEKELERKVTLSFVEKPPTGEDYLKI